jgi:hypothetical protein
VNPTVSRASIALAVAVLAAAVVGILLLMGLRLHEGEGASDQKVRSAVLLVLNDQEDAWNRGDLEGFMNGYWKSEELTFQSGDNVTKGWQATYDRYRARYQTSHRDAGVADFAAQLQAAQGAAPGGPPLATLARSMTALAVQQADLFTPEMGTLMFRELQVTPQGAKSAEVRGRWALAFRRWPAVSGGFTLLLRKEQQGWCIVRDETTKE